MKLLKPVPNDPLEWEVIDDADTPTKVWLSDNQMFEITEESDRRGLHYLAVRTADGMLAIYPDASNKVLFQVKPN